MYRFLLAAIFIFGAGVGYTKEIPAQPTQQADFEKAEQLSDKDKVDTAEKNLNEMRKILTDVLKILKESRDQKDVIKMNCVNEKLINTKGLIRISEQADIVLQEAVTKGEKDSSTHEFQKIAIAHQKIKILKTEAEQCVGELAFAVGKTTVEVEIDKDMVPENDPTAEKLPDTPIIRPPAASPYQ